MIFVTVGAQMPFDRLIKAVDRWAGRRGRNDVLAQVGDTNYQPAHLQFIKHLNPDVFRQACVDADVIVAHAGMGSIITALELGKPILVMPRRASMRETRNDHQVATADRFFARGQVYVAMNEEEIDLRLDEIESFKASAPISTQAPPPLREAIRRFVAGEEPHTANRCFDSVICFGGEDWWYHNRGHYDMQMMYQWARRVPVLYVNSIGMRPLGGGEAGSTTIKRVRRKLRSIAKGLAQPMPNFWTLSPLTSPSIRHLPFGRWALAAQIRWAMRRMHIEAPLIWVACPPAAEVLDDIKHVGLVYQRTDRYESFPAIDVDEITRCDVELKRRADLTLFCSRLLYDAESPLCHTSAYVDHGVDYERFAGAGDRRDEPSDITNIPRPRIGFIGGIDLHTFDPHLFCAVARRLPACSFVLIGGCSLPAGWCNLANVHMLGQKPYESVAAYMAACDVLIMPWNRSEWIRACNPVKLKEYLAVGRPVVSTPFEEIERYRPYIAVASDADEFSAAVSEACEHPPTPNQLRDRVQGETWDARMAKVCHELKRCGLQQKGWQDADKHQSDVNTHEPVTV